MGSNTDGRHVITTRSGRAAERYRCGLRLVVESSPEARGALAAAVAADARLAVAHAALAVVLAHGGAAHDAHAALMLANATAHLATRRERQHVEIIGLVLAGDQRRAHALGAEHLLEFAGDELIEWLVTT
jgi:hypothetical protein